MTRVALVLPNWIGDAIQATPLLAALREHLGARAEIHAVGKPPVLEVLADHPALTALHARPGGGKLAAIRGLARLFRTLAPESALLLTNDLPSALAARLARVPKRIGYDRRGRGPLLTTALPPPRAGRRLRPVPAVDYYLGLARALGWQGEAPPLSLAAPDRRETEALLAAFPEARPLAVVSNSGAFGPAKLWTDAGVVGLARALAARGLNVLLLGGPAELEAARRNARAAESPQVLAAGDLAPPSLALSKALISQARLLVSSDSGPRHMGPAFGVPTVSLFGPTDPVWTDLKTPLDRWVRLDLDCQPCQQRVCPLGHHRCMRELSVERVLEAVEGQLAL